MSRIFAYCRVSTLDQTTDNQALEIASAGFAVEPHRIIAESVSGSCPAAQRPGWQMLLNKLESGDVLIVTKLDRLGRNAIDVLATVDHMTGLGVRVHCLALGGVDLTSPAGRMTMTIIAAVAQFERDLIVERTQAGLARAKAAGKKLGRREILSGENVTTIKQMAANGHSMRTIGKIFNCSASLVHSVVNGGKDYLT